MKPENQKANHSATPKKDEKQNPLNAYLKYSGLAFQVCAVIGLAVWGGLALDDKFMNGKPLFVLILSVIGIGASIYVFIKALPKE